MSEIKGSQEKPQATSHPRPGAVTLRSHPKPKGRASGQEEQPEEWCLRRHRRALEELSHVEGQEWWR